MPPKRAISGLIKAITILYTYIAALSRIFLAFTYFPWYFLILYANFLFIQLIYISCILYIENV